MIFLLLHIIFAFGVCCKIFYTMLLLNSMYKLMHVFPNYFSVSVSWEVSIMILYIQWYIDFYRFLPFLLNEWNLETNMFKLVCGLNHEFSHVELIHEVWDTFNIPTSFTNVASSLYSALLISHSNPGHVVSFQPLTHCLARWDSYTRTTQVCLSTALRREWQLWDPRSLHTLRWVKNHCHFSFC